MIFELGEYTARKYVMHCDTFEKAQIFLQYLHNHGMTWRDGLSYDVSILEFDHFDWSFTEETTIDSEAFNEMLEVM